MVFLYALRVSGFHCCRANACTICSVVTSLGPDGMSSFDRWTILYRRLLIVCADRPAALRVSVHPSMLLRHGTGALILFLMIHHGHPDLHAAKLSLDKLGSPMDLNRGPLVSPEVHGSNPCPATNESQEPQWFLTFLFSYWILAKPISEQNPGKIWTWQLIRLFAGFEFRHVLFAGLLQHVQPSFAKSPPRTGIIATYHRHLSSSTNGI